MLFPLSCHSYAYVDNCVNADSEKILSKPLVLEISMNLQKNSLYQTKLRNVFIEKTY